MPRVDLDPITHWITAAAVQHPDDLAGELQRRLHVGRAAARRTLARLAEARWLVREGTPRRPRHRPGALRQVVRTYALAGLQEDRPWIEDFAPHFALPPAVRRLARHVFTELVNNAVDHSEGTRVTVSLRQTPTQAQLLVSDDGRGLFDKLRAAFALPDPALAMLELGKGKLTSDPARHGGRGLFFSARAADVFDLHANAAAFRRRAWEGDGWHRGRALDRRGTSIYAAIALDTTRTLESVFAAHSLDGRGVGFERTVVALQLLADQGELATRAQARRAASGLARFARAELDFAGITHVGHSFADELFRVLAPQTGALELVPLNMAGGVAAMVDGVRREGRPPA
jgi:anti-sigma regulatory factor (Ser/Thr protein kinase)